MHVLLGASLKIVAISDTHTKRVSIPDGDVLVHAGDATFRGTPVEVASFAERYGSLPHKYKIFVAGNHDWLFQNDPHLAQKIMLDNGIMYLQDERAVIEGVRFYGSPWQPEFCNWAFNAPRGPALAHIWSRIPDDTEVLITHGPPHGLLDVVPEGARVGCTDLMSRINCLRELKLHVFGHIHYSHGSCKFNEVTFANVAICDEQYRPYNRPFVHEI